jgi:hypothetical protein
VWQQSDRSTAEEGWLSSGGERSGSHSPVTVSQVYQADNLQHTAADTPLNAHRIAALRLEIIMASTTAFGDNNSGFQAGTINGPVQASFHYATGKSGRIRGSSER